MLITVMTAMAMLMLRIFKMVGTMGEHARLD